MLASMHFGRTLLTAAALIALAFSGCTDSGSDTPAGTDTAHHEETVPTAEDFEATAPDWHVGRHFGHHIFFGADDTQGSHINTTVYEADGSSYTLGTDDQETAELHAIFDFPILGAFQKDLSATSFGGPFNMYSFPIRDGKTWDAPVTLEQDQFGNGVTRNAQVTATFNPEIRLVVDTSTSYPGFDLVGTVDGEVLFETNYIPEIGWYGEFLYYDLNSEDPDDFMFRVISMGFGHDFASDIGGTVYDITANEVLNHFQQTIVPAGEVSLLHQEPFTIAPETTKIMGIIFAFAVAGHSEIDFVDPNGVLHQWQQATDVPTSPDQSTWGTGGGNLYSNIAVIAGEWNYANWNVGFAGGAGAQIWELQENQIVF